MSVMRSSHVESQDAWFSVKNWLALSLTELELWIWCTRHTILTNWGRYKMDVILQMTIAFTWMKMYQLQSRFHWKIFLHLLRKWLSSDKVTCHYLNQWWLVYWRIYASLGLSVLIHSTVGILMKCEWDTLSYVNITKQVLWYLSTTKCKTLQNIYNSSLFGLI